MILGIILARRGPGDTAILGIGTHGILPMDGAGVSGIHIGPSHGGLHGVGVRHGHGDPVGDLDGDPDGAELGARLTHGVLSHLQDRRALTISQVQEL